MRITALTITHFRCFTERTFPISSKFVLLEGANGSGKTSILEALYYSCYLRSFRTHVTKELIQSACDHSFMRVRFEDDHTDTHEIQVGIASRQKLVRLDGKTVQSHKEIVSRFRIIAATEDDLALVQDAPEERRRFLDQAMVLDDPGYITVLREYKQTVSQRNALLQTMRTRSFGYQDNAYETWSAQLWHGAEVIQKARRSYLALLEHHINRLLTAFFASSDPDLAVQLVYEATRVGSIDSFEEFWAQFIAKGGPEQELRFGRSLFGAHLDDVAIIFKHKRARAYASRGQQKLIVFLIKVAQYLVLSQGSLSAPRSGVMLFDDFMTDFDTQRMEQCLRVLNGLSAQVFIACPLRSFIFSGNSEKFDVNVISL